MDDEFERGSFDIDNFVERQKRSFLSEFGWPEIDDDFSAEEGEGESW